MGNLEMLKLYEGGYSQTEIAAASGISQSRICIMLRSTPGYIPRSRAKRNQMGPNHPLWGGTNITYKAAHLRVSRYRGQPQHCEMCGDSSPGPRRGKYDWCNITGNYHDVNDYKRMCRKCHRSFDDSKRVPKYCVPSSSNPKVCQDCRRFVSENPICAASKIEEADAAEKVNT